MNITLLTTEFDPQSQLNQAKVDASVLHLRCRCSWSFFCVGESLEIQGSHIFEKNNDTMMLGGRSSLSKGSYVSHRYGNWLPSDSRWELCLNKRLLPKAKGRRAETSLKIQWKKALFRFGALDLQLQSFGEFGWDDK